VLTTPGGSQLVEFPISVLRYAARRFDCGRRLFPAVPYRFSRWALRKLNARKQEFVFYIHPWEVDPEQPRVEEAGALSRFRHYLNLDRCAHDSTPSRRLRIRHDVLGLGAANLLPASERQESAAVGSEYVAERRQKRALGAGNRVLFPREPLGFGHNFMISSSCDLGKASCPGRSV